MHNRKEKPMDANKISDPESYKNIQVQRKYSFLFAVSPGEQLPEMSNFPDRILRISRR